MKSRLLSLLTLLSVALAVGTAQAQSNSTITGQCEKQPIPGSIVAVGPPMLTLQAADCALDFIAFTASAVKGVKGMEIDQAMREKWHAYLAINYPLLAPADRLWFANTPQTMQVLRASYPRLSWYQRTMMRQQWAQAMPGILKFVAPVVMTSQQGASRQSLARQLGDMIRKQQLAAMMAPRPQQPSASASRDLQVAQGLYNNGARAITLQTGMQNMANDTINLMHSYSH